MVTEVAQRLKDQHHPVCTLALRREAEFSKDSDSAFTIDGESAEHWAEVFRSLSKQAPYAPDGICWFVGDSNADLQREPLGNAKSECIGLLNLLLVVLEVSAFRFYFPRQASRA